MRTAEQLREHERLCRARAETARDPISRANFLALAYRFRREAEHTETGRSRISPADLFADEDRDDHGPARNRAAAMHYE